MHMAPDADLGQTPARRGSRLGRGLAGHTRCVSEQAPDGLIPEGLVERGDLWTIAVNRNQDLLGKTMIVLNRACEAVTDLEQEEWLDLHRQIGRLVEVLDVLFHPDLYNFAFL